MTDVAVEESSRDQYAAILDGTFSDDAVSEEIVSGESEPTPETDDVSEVAATDALMEEVDEVETGEAEEEAPETDDVSESEPLDFDALIAAGAKITIEGQTHKVEDVIKHYRDLQVEKQQFAESKKAFEREKSEVNDKLDERDRILERLQTDNIGLALDAAGVTSEDLKREFLEVALKYGYDPKDAETSRLQRELEKRTETESKENERREQRDKENNARVALEASIGIEVNDDEWEDVKSTIPLMLRRNPNSQTPLTDAWHFLHPKKKVPVRKPPKNEAPTKAMKSTGLKGKSRAELAQLLE